MEVAKKVSIILIILYLFGTSTFAGVVLDGTMGPSGALSGPKYAITSDLGKQYGGNLFHSFSAFNLVNGDTALFSGPTNVQNIISRVTGGSTSNIDGTIRSSIQGANMYLLNPAGLMFGPNARLDITGSFYAGTADYLKLGTTGRFDAFNHSGSVLTVDSPSAFGFVGTTPSGISLNGSFLKVPEGKAIGMISGDQTIQDGTLHAPSGTVNLVSVASKGEAIAGGDSFQTDSFSNMGKIGIGDTRQASERPAYDFTAIKRIGNVDVSGGNSGGKIFVRGGDFILVNGVAKADTFGGGNAQGIDIKLTGNLDSSNGSFIASRPFAGGSGGSISLTAPLLTLNGSYITSESYDYSTGNAGNIFINAGKLTAKNGSYIIADTYGNGKGGSLEIKASDSLSLKGQSYITSGAWSNGDAGIVNITVPLANLDGSYIEAEGKFSSESNAGNVLINVSRLTGSNGSIISTSTYGAGSGGSLEIKASESVTLSGLLTSVNSSTWTGTGGSVTVRTPLLEMDNGASLSTSASFTGKAGNVFVSADTINLKNHSYISTATFGRGMGGALSLVASSISLDNSAYISSDTIDSSGNGGPLDIKAASLMLDHDSWITSKTSGSGNSGGMLLNLDTLQLRNGSSINASTIGNGHGGDLNLYASKSVFLSDDLSAISAFSGNYNGNGGSISLKTPDLLLDNDARISAFTAGRGNAGSINLDVGHVDLKNGANITVSTSGLGSGGILTVNAADYISVAGRSCMTSSSSLGGSGGSLFIQTPALSILDWGFLSSATSGTGNAGKIELTLGTLDLQNGGRIYSDSLGNGVGRAGSIVVNAEQTISIMGLWSSISSNTSSKKGDGGAVLIKTPSLTVDSGEISCYTLGSGLGGNVRIDAGEVRLTNEASISSESTGTGKAGDIIISAINSLTLQDSSITAATVNADGGNIKIDPALVDLRNSRITATVKGGTGNGGNVDVSGTNIILDESKIIANAEGGNGGNITINATVFLTSPDSVVTASSKLGLQGTVEIKAPVIDVSSSLVNLPSTFLNVESLAPKQCATTEEEMSTFVVTYEGIPPKPDQTFISK
jgi:filamentous hemagglutinin family protein